MQDTLYIRLATHNDALEWVLLASNGDIKAGPSTDLSDSLLEYAKDVEVVVLVPGVHVLLTTVQVPKMTHTRLMQAIPNLLEEILVEPVANLHFAIGQFVPGQPLVVAVVSKEKMQSWLDFIGEKIPGIQSHIDAFLPDTLALPWSENQWTALVDDHQVLVRMGEYSGFTAEPTLFAMLTQRMLDRHGAPDAIHIYGTVDGQDVSELGVSVNQHQAPDSVIVMAAEYLQGEVPINLLQEEFERDHKARVTKKLIQVLAVMVAVWVGTLTVIDITKYVFLQGHATKLKGEIAVVYKEIFPKSTTVVSPRRRIERLLKQTEGAGTSDFIRLLARVSPVVDKQKSIKLSELDYDQGELTLKVEATDFDYLDQLVSELKATGVQVEQSGASKIGGTIQSKVVVRL